MYGKFGQEFARCLGKRFLYIFIVDGNGQNRGNIRCRFYQNGKEISGRFAYPLIKMSLVGKSYSVQLTAERLGYFFNIPDLAAILFHPGGLLRIGVFKMIVEYTACPSGKPFKFAERKTLLENVHKILRTRCFQLTFHLTDRQELLMESGYITIVEQAGLGYGTAQDDAFKCAAP